jgi:hypothetical protein
MEFDFSQIKASRAAARRERAHYVYSLLVRARLWLLARLPGGVASPGPCCEPA